MKQVVTNKSEITDVTPRDVPTTVVETDPTRFTRIGWMILLVGVVGFASWASFAPLDKGVPLSGSVTVSGSRKSVQHTTGGLIDDILVKEGDLVKAGQVLVRMNTVQTKAGAEITRGQLYSVRATAARLMAERDGKAAIAFPADLLAARTDPRVSEAMTLQSALFSSRRSALENEINAIHESMAGIKLQLAGMRESRESKKFQLQILQEQLTNLRELSKDGFIARNRMLEVERTNSQLIGALAEDTGNIGRSERQLSELGLRITQRQQEYQREVRTVLSDVLKEEESLASRLVSLDFDLANTDVKSPVAGTVVGVNVVTRGGVVPPGMRMMEVVPLEDGLVIEGQLPVQLVDKVHAGLKVELIFSAFNTNKTPHIPGEITHVSADRITDERTGIPYYKVKAKVSPEGAKQVAKLAVRPGMPVDMFIKTGERSMMSYLFKPVIDRTHSAMTEE